MFARPGGKRAEGGDFCPVGQVADGSTWCDTTRVDNKTESMARQISALERKVVSLGGTITHGRGRGAQQQQRGGRGGWGRGAARGGAETVPENA